MQYARESTDLYELKLDDEKPADDASWSFQTFHGLYSPKGLIQKNTMSETKNTVTLYLCLRPPEIIDLLCKTIILFTACF